MNIFNKFYAYRKDIVKMLSGGLIACAFSFWTPPTHAAGFGDLLGGDKKEEQAAPDAGAAIAEILKELSKAAEIEAQGFRMITLAETAYVEAGVVFGLASQAVGEIANIIDQINSGAQVISNNAGGMVANAKIAQEAIRQYGQEKQAEIKERENQARDAAKSEGKNLKEQAAKAEDKKEPGRGLKVSMSSSPDSEFQIIEQGGDQAIDAFDKMADSRLAEVQAQGAAVRQAFFTDIILPVNQGLGSAQGILKGTMDKYPSILGKLDRIDREAQEAGKQIVVEGVKTVAILALQQEKIMDIIDQLKSNPLGNMDKINDLKAVLDLVLDYIDLIKGHNEKIETVNVQLAQLSGVMGGSKSLFETSMTKADALLQAMDNAAVKVLASLDR